MMSSGVHREVGDLGEVIRARKPKRLPVVMSRDEVKSVLANLTGDKWLMASLTPRNSWKAAMTLEPCRNFLAIRKTTMIDTHVLNRGGKGVRNPVDDL